MSKSSTTRSLIPPPRPPKPPLGVRRPAYSSWDSHTPVTMRPIIVTTPPPPEVPPIRARVWPAILFVTAVFLSGAVTATLAHRTSLRAFASAPPPPSVMAEPPIVETIAFPPPPYVTVTAAPVASAPPSVTVSASPASPASIRPRAVTPRVVRPVKSAEPVNDNSSFEERF